MATAVASATPPPVVPLPALPPSPAPSASGSGSGSARSSWSLGSGGVGGEDVGSGGLDRFVYRVPEGVEPVERWVFSPSFAPALPLSSNAYPTPPSSSSSSTSSSTSSSSQHQQIDFCNAFWGSSPPGGVPVLFARLRGAIKSTDEIRRFWEARAGIEEEYAGKLMELANGATKGGGRLGREETGQLRNALDTLLLETATQATAHLHLASTLRHAPLLALLKMQIGLRKDSLDPLAERFAARHTKAGLLDAARTKLADAQARLRAASSESEEPRTVSSAVPDASVRKARLAVSVAEREVAGLLADGDASFEGTHAWEADWKLFCDLAQDVEEERIELVRDAIARFGDAVRTVGETDGESAARVRTAVSSISPERELAAFVQTYGTGNALPDLPTRTPTAAPSSASPPRRAEYTRITARAAKSPSSAFPTEQYASFGMGYPSPRSVEGGDGDDAEHDRDVAVLGAGAHVVAEPMPVSAEYSESDLGLELELELDIDPERPRPTRPRSDTIVPVSRPPLPAGVGVGLLAVARSVTEPLPGAATTTVTAPGLEPLAPKRLPSPLVLASSSASSSSSAASSSLSLSSSTPPPPPPPPIQTTRNAPHQPIPSSPPPVWSPASALSPSSSFELEVDIFSAYGDVSSPAPGGWVEFRCRRDWAALDAFKVAVRVVNEDDAALFWTFADWAWANTTTTVDTTAGYAAASCPSFIFLIFLVIFVIILVDFLRSFYPTFLILSLILFIFLIYIHILRRDPAQTTPPSTILLPIQLISGVGAEAATQRETVTHAWVR
ncbi:hypothetical protein HMN09_00134300 [Mycena chlorophos]|uniref:F-BAR domain-containing protein n=1 Tax=Mycena chlorophos TaxID=658473 RepID=A0A8H6WK93_MYCCL|nr:hypothetical protein HMN09_00134300 [Mycena chlorophos]